MVRAADIAPRRLPARGESLTFFTRFAGVIGLILGAAAGTVIGKSFDEVLFIGVFGVGVGVIAFGWGVVIAFVLMLTRGESPEMRRRLLPLQRFLLGLGAAWAAASAWALR